MQMVLFRFLKGQQNIFFLRDKSLNEQELLVGFTISDIGGTKFL